MRKTVILISLFAAFTTLFADQFDQRHLMKRDIYYVTGDGTVGTAEYWSVTLGQFDFSVNREYPGEGTLPVSGSANLNFLSSGYIEGAGYGERGAIKVNADFVVASADSLVEVELDQIDFVFYGGTRVMLNESDATQELYLKIESPENKVQARGTSIMIYKFDESWGELKHDKDVDNIVGFSFTRAGATRAYQAALSAN